jgi:hypothetical protein
MSSRADLEDRVPHGQEWSGDVPDLYPIIAHSGIEDARSTCAGIVVNAAAVIADRTITHYCIRQGRVVHPPPFPLIVLLVIDTVMGQKLPQFARPVSL